MFPVEYIFFLLVEVMENCKQDVIVYSFETGSMVEICERCE